MALPQGTPENPYTIREDVINIVVPVTVRRPDGMPVGGIRSQQFRLFDNRRLQDIKVDADYLPVSLVLVVQANSRAEGAVKRVKETPALMQSLIVGEQGEAAVLAFDHRMQVKCDFTTDFNKLKAGVDSIKVGSNSAALNDAVMTAINMLKRRDKNRRRVILLIAETRDGGSEQNTRNVVSAAEMNNIQVYAVNISQVLKQLGSTPQPPRPDPIPPEARGLYPGMVNTPTTVAQASGSMGQSVQFVPLLEELYRGVKGLFWRNPQEALVRATGGREFSFATCAASKMPWPVSAKNCTPSTFSVTPQPGNARGRWLSPLQIVVDGYSPDWVKHRPDITGEECRSTGALELRSLRKPRPTLNVKTPGATPGVFALHQRAQAMRRAPWFPEARRTRSIPALCKWRHGPSPRSACSSRPKWPHSRSCRYGRRQRTRPPLPGNVVRDLRFFNGLAGRYTACGSATSVRSPSRT